MLFRSVSLAPRRVIASDFAIEMLATFRKKLGSTGAHPVDLVSCNAMELPFPDASFDATIVAFGIRNFSDRLSALREMLRVLKPDGISVILELTTPTTPGIAQLYKAYSRWGLPLVGKVISRNDSAYSYLPASITKFPPHAEFLNLMSTAGFSSTECAPQTFGVATIYSGKKGIIPRA